MKLRLPSPLRHALLSCLAALSAVSAQFTIPFAAAYASYALTQQAFAVPSGWEGVETISKGGTGDGALDTWVNSTDKNVAGGKVILEAKDQDKTNDFYFKNGGCTFNADVCIGDAGLEINNGYSSTGGNIIFAGAVVGSGKFDYFGTPANQTWIFRGDMSQYTGDISIRSTDIKSINHKLRFQGITSGTGSISIETASSTLYVDGSVMQSSKIKVVDLSVTKYDDSHAESTFKTAVINASNKLTVETGATANFEGKSEVNTADLEIKGTLNIKSGVTWANKNLLMTSSGAAINIAQNASLSISHTNLTSTTIDIYGNFETKNSSETASGSTFIVRSGGTFTVGGTNTFNSSNTLKIEDGGSIVYSNSTASFTVNGTLEMAKAELSALPVTLGAAANITVTGTATLAANEELEFTTTGAKKFTGGIDLGEGSRLIVSNTNWEGSAYGKGTVELRGIGYNVQGSSTGIIAANNLLSADKTLRALELTNGTNIDIQTNWTTTNMAAKMGQLEEIYVKSGASLGFNNSDSASGKSGQKLHLSGTGTEEVEGSTNAGVLAGSQAALYINSAGNQNYDLNWDIILDDDATVYVGYKTDRTVKLLGKLELQNHTLTLVGGGVTEIGADSAMEAGKAGSLNIKEGTLNLRQQNKALLSTVNIALGDTGTLNIAETGYSVARLSGTGQITGTGTLLVTNSDTAANDSNTFRGTWDSGVQIELHGYLTLSRSLTSTLSMDIESGTLNLSGSSRANGAALDLRISATGALSNATLHHGDKITAASALRLNGSNTIVLTDDMQSVSAADAILQFGGRQASVTLASGASLMVDMSHITSTLTKREPVSYRIANVSISSLENTLTFGSELAVFNLQVSLDEQMGCLSFSSIRLSDDTLYQSSRDNEGDGTTDEWYAGDDVYSSTDRLAAVFIDRNTHIDLTGSAMGVHEDGLILKNLVGGQGGDLTVDGLGTGTSKITLNNSLTDEELKQYERLLPGIKVENSLTYAGNITINKADLQIKHGETDSITRMYGRLIVRDGELQMTRGVLELVGGSGHELGNGVYFTGNDGQIVLNSASAAMSGFISVEGTAAAKEHILLKNNSVLTISNAAIGNNVWIGNDAAKGSVGVVSLQGANELGSGVRLSNVVLHLANGASLTEAGKPTPIALDDTVHLNLTGLAGSGALGVTRDMNIAPSANYTYSGSLQNYKGTMRVSNSKYTQTFSGVLGNAGWNLVNNGHVVLNMGATAANSMRMGSLELGDGSTTRLLLDFSKLTGKNLTLDSLSAPNGGASLSIGQYSGTYFLEGLTGGQEVSLTIGTVAKNVDPSTLNPADWEVTGIRNLRDAHGELHYDIINHEWELRIVGIADNTNTYAEVAPSGNAGAGAGLLWGVTNASAIGGDLLALDNRIYSLLSNNGAKNPLNAAEAKRIFAAAAGASTAVVGQAFAADIERQLRAIRNRTTTMGYTEYDNPQAPELPRISFWLNGEGNYVKQKDDNLNPGYKVNGWGGTVGVAVDTDESMTLGLALNAMYNDLKTTAPDKLDANMDTYNLSAFARIASGAWLHTFVGNAGLAWMNGHRTVDYGTGSYTTNADTQGLGFGLLYEVGYAVPLNEQGSVCLQPVLNISWRYAQMRGYDETGSTAALHVEDQTYSTLTVGLGTRLQALAGGNAINRSAIVEMRALVKMDAGDRRGSSEVYLREAAAQRVSVQGSERGIIGCELGCGITIPMSDSANMFLDLNADLRSKATELNATLGYKFSF